MINYHFFISKLSNLEKKRNFNVFKNYSLEDFENCIKSLGLEEITKGYKRNSVRIGVVGTNGKGSFSHYLKECSLALGCFECIGLYTSPHLISSNERISINSVCVTDEWLNDRLNRFSVKHLKILKKLSFFEIYTLFSILFFEENNCDLEIYEAGLGGQKDATKIVKADYVVLTSIDLDHTEILGETKEEILMEKLGIITENTKILFNSVNDINLQTIIKSFCEEKKISLVQFSSTLTDYLSFYKKFACLVLEHITPNKPKLNLSLGNLPPPKGRMEIIRYNPMIIFDIAHNPAAIEKLLESLDCIYPTLVWTLYFACLKDKNISMIYKILQSTKNVKETFFITGAEFAEYAFPNVKITCMENLSKYLQNATEPILVTGSFRLYPVFASVR
ncbi:MAG: bifunctional folylpolyglutamate synthase/dihydrofolate synthase [Leptospiraceae bacterium]|nr:bifunctional folylpolyglutamate synthase/dihydrofolate synthase [Leptospiraceae bacterium]